MTDSASDAGPDRSTESMSVFLLVSADRNRHLLADHLSHSFAIREPDDASIEEATFDLCLVDGASIRRFEDALSAKKADEAPAFLPYFLLAERRSPDRLPTAVWSLVDEVVTTPVDKAELDVRIENLLGRRRLSLALARQRERSERRKRELKRQNERLDEFASVIAHDLRNPLSVATGRLELGRETGDDRHFDAVERAHERMDQLIEDVLTMTRNGRTAVELTDLPLVAVAEQAWEHVDTGDFTLEVETTTTITANEGRLCEFFENLFRNAIEHGSDDGTVRVDPLDGGGFSVADDGPGIPLEEREQVFEAGYTTREEGTGFGLAIVEQIVEAHGWTIQLAESDAGGTRFEIEVPRT